MSAYTDALAVVAPDFHYTLSETSGNFVDTGLGGASTPLNTLTTPFTRGEASLLPGEPTGRSVFQDKDTDFANRANNAILDQPSPWTRITLACWAKSSKFKLNAAATLPASMPLLTKFTQYQLLMVDTRVGFDIAGITGGTLYSPGDTLIPGNTYFVVGVFDGIAQTIDLYLNGARVSTRSLPAGQVVPYTTNRLRMGGYTEFGNAGLAGWMQHASIFQNRALTAAQIQELYRVGAASDAEQAGQAANVFPWSRVILAASARNKVTITNMSNVAIYAALGGTAIVGGGLRIPSRESREIVGYVGQISAIHRGSTFGSKQVLLAVE